MGESSSYDLTPLFNSFGMRAWRRGVVFYAISSDITDDTGSRIEMSQAGDRLAAFTNTASRFDGYHMLANETSGVAFVGRSAAGAFNFIATGDSVGHSSNVTRQTKEIRWPADAVTRAGDKTLTFRVDVVLQPGRSQISVGVMDEKSQEKGFERLSV